MAHQNALSKKSGVREHSLHSALLRPRVWCTLTWPTYGSSDLLLRPKS